MTIRRMIASAERAGLPVASIEVRPDGSVVVRTIPAEAGEDVFAQWEERL